MIEVIERITGVPMMVAEEQVERFKAAGYILAAKPDPPPDPPKSETNSAQKTTVNRTRKPAAKRTRKTAAKK